MNKIIFPSDFKWGAATASYQIEGAWNEDGKTPSVWDTISHRPGLVLNGDTGDVAMDHYHRYKEDIALLKQLGLQTYRFSLAWARILPNGIGEINTKGITFYNNLIDTLLTADIEPTITLYHWDFPQVLADQGGWENRKSVEWFAEYARVCFKAFGDRVRQWITFNEPWVDAFADAFTLRKPTEKRLKRGITKSHHYLLSHAKAIEIFRSLSLEGKIGITLSLSPAYAATDSQEDREASTVFDGFVNRWFLDPAIKGFYPTDILKRYQDTLQVPDIQPGDMKLIKDNPVDFLGVNYYSRSVIRYAPDTVVLNLEVVEHRDETWATNGEVFPEGLYELLVRLDQDYQRPLLYITENGASFGDEDLIEGKVHDEYRIHYLESHLQAAHRAINQGVNLKRFYVWSCFDNFEWIFGYSRRFGLIYVDFKSQERAWKDSAFWFQTVISNNGFEPLE